MKNNRMKRLLAMALCLCMLLSMYVPSASAAATSYHDMSMSQLLSLDEDLTWVFTGDSITHNGGWTGGYNDYAAWFEKYLYDIGRGDDTLINTAWGGAAIEHFQPTRSGDDGMGLEQFVTKYNPDVVFIKLGMNNRTMDDASFASYYNTMLDGIYAAGEKNGKKPKVVLLSPTPLSGEFGISSGEFGSDPTSGNYYDSVKRFSITLSNIASQRGLLFVDLRQAMVDESAVLGDRFHYTFFSDPSDGLIHPNGAGQYFMFKTICRKLDLYDSSMPIFKVSYDDIIHAPLYSDANAISYTGSYGDGISDANAKEMDKDMPQLEKNTQPVLLAYHDFDADDANTFTGSAESFVDLDDANVVDDPLTLGEVQTIGKEFSVVIRTKLNADPAKGNQALLSFAYNDHKNWDNAFAIGMPGNSNVIYYQARTASTTYYLTGAGTQPAVVPQALDGDGLWHTLVLVQEENALVYYLDGQETFRNTGYYLNQNISEVFADKTEFSARIGNYSSGHNDYNMNAQVDYFQFYKGALNADEVAHLTVNSGHITAAQMNKTMPTLSDASPLAAVDFTSATGIFAGTNSYATSTCMDLTNAEVMNDALTLEEAQAMGREFSIVLRGYLDSTTNRNHQPLLLMNPGAESDWNNSIAVGGPGAVADPNDNSTGHRLYYEVRKEGAEQTSSTNGIPLADGTPDVRDGWHTIAIVQRTDGLDYYIDGVLAESKAFKLNDGVTFGGLFADATDMTAHVGIYAQNGSTTFNLKAKLDYYQFYGTALSAAQVQSLGSGAVTDAEQMNATMPRLSTTAEYVPNLLASVDFTSQNGKLDFGNSAGLRIDTATEGYAIDTLTQAEAATLGTDFSVVFRAKLNSTYQSNQPVLYISSNGTANWQNALVLGAPATQNQLYFNAFAGNAVKKTGTINFSGTTVNGDDQFHTLVVTYDDGTITYFVDGAQIGQATGYGLKDGTSSIGSLFENSTDFAVQIGRYGTEKDGTSYKLKGNFDFWQLYDGVLSASQIQKLSTAQEDAAVTPAVWTDTVKANSLWAVVGANQMSGYLGITPNFSLFRLLNNGMRGGANALGSFRDIRMMNLAKPGQTVGDVVANYDAILGEHQSRYNVLMLLPEVPDVHAAGYTHSADKVAAYKANIQTLIEKNEGKAIVLWTPLASLNATLNGYITDYANAVREIAGNDPNVLLFDANLFMNERIGTVGHNWFDDSMNITPLCATDLVYAFYVHANYPTYDSGKDPTNKGELKNHNLRIDTDKRTYKSGVIKENLSYNVSVNGGTFYVDASNIAGLGYTNLRVAMVSGIGIHSVTAPWILGSVGETLAAPHSNPVITVYGEMGGTTYRFKDVQLALSTSSNLTKPYTKTTDLTGLEVVGAPAIGFSPDKTTYNVELYQYQRQVRIVAEGGNNLNIQVNGKTVDPGSFSQYIEVGSSATVTVTVTGGGVDKTYTLNLTRPKYADIIVTEVMSDGYDGYTRSGADNYELIEIYNASGHDLNLLDYSIGYLREYPYANDKVENGQIPYYFTGNDHNFFGNSYLGINQITKYSSYWADKVDQEPAEVIFPADSTMVIWVKFSKDAGTDYGAALTYETLIGALEAHAGTHTLTADVDMGSGLTVAKAIVPTQEQLVVAEIPYGAAQSNVTQNITTSATNFYMDGFQVQQNYNNRRGWLFVLDDSAVRDYYGALTEAGDDIISAAKYVRPGYSNKLSSVMYYDVTRGMSVVKNPGYWDSNFSTGHTSDQQGYANKTSFGAIEYWQKPYDFGDTTRPVIQNNTPDGALKGENAAIRLDITDNLDVRYLELYVDADNDGTYETVVRKDITLITSAYNAGKVTDVKSYTFTHTLTDSQNLVRYYGFVLDGNNNKAELGSAEAPEVIEIIEPGQLKIDATVVNEAGEASDAKLDVSITLNKGDAQEDIGASYVIYNSENASVGTLTDGKGTAQVGNCDSLIVKGLPNGADYTLTVTVPEGYRDLTPAGNLTGRIGTTTANTAVSSQKILITGDLTVTADVKHVNGDSADRTASVVITLSKGNSPVELAESYVVADEQGNKLGDTADNTITVSLTDGQKAIVKDLPVGAAYTVSASAPEGYELLTDSIDGMLTGASGAAERVSVKEILITGNLTVGASVKRVDNSVSEEKVTVKVALTQGDAQIAPDGIYRVVDAADKDKVLCLVQNGEGTITLGNGEKAIIQNLPAGTAYAISLTSIPEDYEDISDTALSGNVSEDGSTASVAVKEKKITGTLTVNAQVKKVDDTASEEKLTVAISLKRGDSLVALDPSYPVVDGSGNALGDIIHASGTVTLGDGETAVIEGLPVGAQYTVTVTAPTGYENTTTGETTGNMVKAGAAVDVSAQEKLVTGSLTVNATVKTVTGAYSEEKITVKIDLVKGSAPVALETSYDIVDAYGNAIGTVTNGTATIEMSNGQKAIIKNVAEGAAYTVTVTPPAGYENTTTGETTGNVVKAGSAVSVSAKEQLITGTLTVNAQVKNFDNTASDQKVSMVIRLEKGDAPVALDGSYPVVDGSGNVIGETLGGFVTVTLGDGEKAVIEGLPAGAGYTVTVTTPEDFDNITAGETSGKIAQTGSEVTVNLQKHRREAAFNGTEYETLSEALKAATAAGGTVTLQADCEADTVLIYPGVTLDLNGKTLTADYVAAFNTANIVDNSGTKEQVAAGRLITGANNLILQPNNAQMPVYDGEAYIFTAFKYQLAHNTEYTGNGVQINALCTTENVKVIELFKNGAADNGIELSIQLSWDDGDGIRYQDFKFKDETVAAVFASNQGVWSSFGKMFVMTITGIENVQNLKANVVVTSGVRVAVISTLTLPLN